MSHELRTPLNAVIGFSEVLLERMFGELNERQADYVQDILDAGRHLLALLNDVLDLSKVEAGRMELEVTTFPAVDAIHGVLALVRERAGQHGVELRFDPTDAPTHITRRRAAAQAGAAQPGRQRRQVHPGRGQRHRARLDGGAGGARSP